jgi:hypothetical protein
MPKMVREEQERRRSLSPSPSSSQSLILTYKDSQESSTPDQNHVVDTETHIINEGNT